MKKTIQLLGCPMVPPFQETPIFDQLKRPRFGQRCWSGTSRPAPCLGSKKTGLNPTPKKRKKTHGKIIQLFDGYRDLMVINNQLISDILVDHEFDLLVYLLLDGKAGVTHLNFGCCWVNLVTTENHDVTINLYFRSLGIPNWFVKCYNLARRCQVYYLDVGR